MTARWKTPPKRVLLKLSGEALGSKNAGETIDYDEVARIASEIVAAHKEQGTQFGIVVGGGNIWRGEEGKQRGMDRVTADHMGMIATMINALALTEAIEHHGLAARAMSAMPIDLAMEPHIRKRAIRHMEKGRVVVFAGGMGEPNFTTDTAAVNRAIEIHADVLLKGTHGGIDGVFSADPRTDKSATKYDTVSFQEAYEKRLEVMDMTAFTLCDENGLDLIIFDISTPGNLQRVIAGESTGTLVTNNTAA
jgi:uridylate kinase